VLDEQQVAQMLEQVGHEPSEILPLLGELFKELQRAGRVTIDDEIAEAKERILLDRTEELQYRLDRDLSLSSGGELVERRLCVTVGAASAASDQREGRVRHVDALAVGDPAELGDQVR
jgi:hypothetical protein